METMTQKDKELLLKDLCARLAYGVKVLYDNWVKKLQYVDAIYNEVRLLDYITNYTVDIDDVKPYLFPLSSISEEQKSYINGRWGVNEHFEFEIDPLWGEYFVDLSDAVEFINWCYENHFDINGLIPRGLAEDATGLNIY